MPSYHHSIAVKAKRTGDVISKYTSPISFVRFFLSPSEDFQKTINDSSDDKRDSED